MPTKKITLTELRKMIREAIHEISFPKKGEPDVITSLRGIMNRTASTRVFDPKQRKPVVVDRHTANAILNTYDSFKDNSKKEKFVGMGIPKMSSYALNLISKHKFDPDNKLTNEKKTSVNEGKFVGHYQKVGNQTVVDSNFLNLCQRVLPNSEMVHLGMGFFELKTPNGEIVFTRLGTGSPILNGISTDFVGRAHIMSDNKGGKLVDELIKSMVKKKTVVMGMGESVSNDAMLEFKKYSGDPIWITAKFAGVDMYGTPFKKGEQILYYPRQPKGKNIIAGKKAKAAYQDFVAAAEDEDFYSSLYPSYE